MDDYENISNSLQADLIKETNSGYLIEDKNHLKKTLKLLYSEFQLNGKINCNNVNSDYYSRKNQVKVLSEIIHNIITNN